MEAVKVPKGKYIVAVSGGVDSMALLHMLFSQAGVEIVVAHVNHGIRKDADRDEQLVHSFCMSHNITYACTKLHLGTHASEEVARVARYNFLRQCRITYNADSIITAHHQDDLIETVIINLLRGTGWRGLAPFNQPGVLRPLIKMTKAKLRAYAKAHNVPWREDATNTDQTYLRNYVRLSLVPCMQRVNRQWQTDILRHIRNQQQLRRTIEREVAEMLKKSAQHTDDSLAFERHQLIMLPDELAYELLQYASRTLLGQSLLRSMAQAVLVFAKVARPAKTMPLNSGWQVRATKGKLIVERRSTVVS